MAEIKDNKMSTKKQKQAKEIQHPVIQTLQITGYSPASKLTVRQLVPVSR